jgi:aryl-alcohol dehydrogenase-like predicted oxidoreductase
MEFRSLGASGLKVPVLGFGAATFGGQGALFAGMGSSNADEARRLVDICLDSGVNMFDSADIYSYGASEDVLGQAIAGRRDKVLISTKMTLPLGRGLNERGSSRYRMIPAVDKALQRLRTDYIDIFQLHGFDAFTPIEEVLYTFDQLVRLGKIRYIGVSNFAGWQLMKSLAISDKYGWPRYIAHEVNYSLIARDYEWELMPLGLDQRVGALIWSPLGWGRLTGKIRRGQPLPEVSRLRDTADFAPPVQDELLFRVIDALDAVAAETGKSIPQIAIAWLLARPTVCSVIIGARNEAQLRDNLGAVGWKLTPEQIKRLDQASAVMPAYPYYSARIDKAFNRLNPPAV